MASQKTTMGTGRLMHQPGWKFEGNGMSAEYTAKDPSLPLLMPQAVFQREIYEPVSALVDYVNALFGKGYSPDTLRQDLLDIYALDFYIAQVHNGGHTQYLHNCFKKRERFMEEAARAARSIGLSEIADLVDQCADFNRRNPDSADRPDRYENPAEELKDLDSELYALDFTPEERSDFLNSLPPGHCDHLRDKFRIEAVDKTSAAVVAEVERLLPERTDDYAAKRAAEFARPFYEKKVSKISGPEPSDYKNGEIERNVESLARRIETFLQDPKTDNRSSKLADVVREKLLEPGYGELSRYSLHVAAWIAQHPDLELIPSDAWNTRIEAIVASSPFTGLEMQRRELERVTSELPDDEQVAKSAIIAMLSNGDCKKPTYDYRINDAYLWPRYKKAYIFKMSDSKFYFCISPDNRFAVHSVAKSWSFRMAKIAILALLQLGLIQKSELWAWPTLYAGRPSPNFFSEKRSALTLRILRWLTSFPVEVVGKRFTHRGIVPNLAARMCDLHVPEAYMQWSEGAEETYHFGWGILESLDTDARRLVWRFPLEDEVHQMVACPEFVEFSVVGQNRKARYQASELSDLRRKLSRPADRSG
ncbi:DMP19 family protein [Roseibium sp. M-1]